MSSETPSLDGDLRELRQAVAEKCHETLVGGNEDRYAAAKAAAAAAESRIRTTVRALQAERDAYNFYGTTEHRHRVEAELESQGLRAFLDELAVMADALRDPMAAAYDGPTTRAVIVNKLQAYYAEHCATRRSQEDSANG